MPEQFGRRVYLIKPRYDAEGELEYAWLNVVRSVDWLHEWNFDGTPKADCWRAQEAEVELCGLGLPRADFPFLNNDAIVFAPTALSHLANDASASGELLDLHTGDGERYVLVNVIPLFDCVDLESTEWNTPPSGRRLWVERYQFIKDRLPDVPFFKTRADPGHILTTDGGSYSFMRRVEGLGLRGLEFREVWNDEGREIPRRRP